ncbi:hypothetical protein ANCCAN_07859 [Ancylostoma caninum]|uniref:Uncharacterized protein n=1 Tax=Ancylostoma caninum TaxID=29170 RepID=A0A368GT12_ANCCA|nr:hypothetical protein ANCCAN_07859 [Ancylostoma caninum]
MSKITLLLQALGDEHSSLRTTLDYYKSSTSPNQFPEGDEKEIKNYCYSRQCELQIAERNIERKRSSLKKAYDYVLRSYAEATKEEKKDMIDELNEFQAQVNFRSLLQESDNVIMVVNARLTELETQMAILNLGKPKEMDKNAPHSSIKGHYSQHMDDETKGIIDPLLGAHNEQPDDQYGSQQGTRANILSQENALDLTPVLRIKYPEIKRPTFSGDNDSWEEFWDTYSLIVDKNPQLGNLEKILYLKDALRNQALDAVKSISKKADNYKLICRTVTHQLRNGPYFVPSTRPSPRLLSMTPHWHLNVHGKGITGKLWDFKVRKVSSQ